MKLTDSTPAIPSAPSSSGQAISPAAPGLLSAHFPAGEVQDLICFSHLRWNFVYQRPQHLLGRATKTYRVWFVEEPIWGGELRMDVDRRSDRLTVLVPHLPHGLPHDDVFRVQRQLLDEVMQQERITNYIAWYYTPMALLFSDHLQPRLTVYDCMDELSAFHGAPPQCWSRKSG